MKKIVILNILFFFSSTTFAQSAFIRFARPDYVNFQETLMVMTAYGIPIKNIAQDKKELTVVPAYVSAESSLQTTFNGGEDAFNKIDTSSNANSIKYEESEASGGGVIVNWFHGLGKNWGYSITGSHVRLSGEMSAWVEYDASGNNARVVKAEESGNATQIMANLVYDPYYDSPNFSLPLFVGIGFYQSSQEATASKTVNVTGLSNVPVNYKAEIDDLSLGLSLGFAFSYTYKWLKSSIFFMALFAPESPDYNVTATRTDTGQSLLNDFVAPNENEKFFPSGGLTLTFLPWDVSASWIPNWFNLFGGESDGGGFSSEETSQSVITLSKTFEF